MTDDTEFNVGLVAITMRPQDVDFRGVPVSAGRGGAAEPGDCAGDRCRVGAGDAVAAADGLGGSGRAIPA